MQIFSDTSVEVEGIIARIRQIARQKSIVVAFSGGLDSTVVLALAKEALGKERVTAVNVDFGLFTYNRARQNVSMICEAMGIKLHKIAGISRQMEIMQGGPDCNLCTRKIKLGLVRAYAGEQIILTGSNQSDSWGKYGEAFTHGYYAPLFSYSKKEIKSIAAYLHIEHKGIGENTSREGCKLKHLLKPLINPSFHGQAVSRANEILLEQIAKLNLQTEIANAKIIGPLNKNIALINIFPLPKENYRNEISNNIAQIEEIDSYFIVDRPLELMVKANKGQFNNFHSRYWVEKGRLQPEFAAPIRLRWLLTTNHQLKTFQVVDYNYYEE